MPAQKIRADRVLHALGDPTRRAIVERLGEGPRSVSALAEPLGVTVTAIGQHLQVLEECGLARTEKIGRVRSCRIETAGLTALEQWIRERRTIWESRLDRLDDVLGEASTPRRITKSGRAAR
jgi:DNA-binding transcriptional ArsR family regulator